eukprot:TRINITY_DN29834_c0_g2_i1.p1 TRINITY_DN29834_c0_g2~~TRINITY_DN29834_c0_g2_i1.p1  ORF type:complete len:332 (-),score=53.58 TRINITY_DN29834_c0_g2_i1:200-1102(-)
MTGLAEISSQLLASSGQGSRPAAFAASFTTAASAVSLLLLRRRSSSRGATSANASASSSTEDAEALGAAAGLRRRKPDLLQAAHSVRMGPDAAVGPGSFGSAPSRESGLPFQKPDVKIPAVRFEDQEYGDAALADTADSITSTCAFEGGSVKSAGSNSACAHAAVCEEVEEKEKACAEVEQVQAWHQIADRNGLTPLHLAASQGTKAALNSVLREIACAAKSPCERAYLQTTALAERDHWGETALHHAVRARNMEVAEGLLLHGADMFSENDNGETPASMVEDMELGSSEKWVRLFEGFL